MIPSMETLAPAAEGWWSRVWQRICFQTWLKAIGTSAFMFLFFRAYFALLENPQADPTVMPEIWLDHWVQFTPSAFPVYLSLWVYVSLAPALIGNLRALIWFGVWVGALCLTGLAIFWAWPTQTPVFDVDWALYPGLALIKGVDAAGNACPSLHVASSVYSAFWLARIFRETQAPATLRWLSVLHCIVIVWSTMAIRQHVFLDVVAGVAVGWAFAWVALRWTKEHPPAPLRGLPTP